MVLPEVETDRLRVTGPGSFSWDDPATGTATGVIRDRDRVRR
jgi:hypothetical protein